VTATTHNIIVTASDDCYAPLVIGLLQSLRSLKTTINFDIGVFDLGLNDAHKEILSSFGVQFAKPGIDMDYPGREAWERQAPYYRAMTSRPFLRDYFTGYQTYMWMDADSWVQTPEAIETMLTEAAQDNALYIASEIDRDYLPYFQSSQPWEYHYKWYSSHFPRDIVSQFFPRPMLNTGVMAASATAPFWTEWANFFKDCLARIPHMTRENFMSEQLSLNVALHLKGLPFKVMPSEFNWLSLYALPMLDHVTNKYVRPTPPRSTISVLHMTHLKKIHEVELKTTEGRTIKRCLMFPR